MKKADKSRYANGNDIRLVNLGPIALISIFKLTTSSEGHPEDNNHAHNVFLMYKLITSAKDSDHLSIGFDRDRVRRQQKINSNKNIEDKFHVRIMLKDVFGFVEHQEKTTYGLGF